MLPRFYKQNKKVLYIVFSALIVAVILLGSYLVQSKKIIKIGIIHSLTGNMAISERPLIHAYEMAIAEVNENDGIPGAKIVPIIIDGETNPEVFAREAENLIVKEKVTAIFGCWTSLCRKAVKEVVEKYQSLLFYPLQYEGLEKSPNIIYLGAAPNQQIIPGVSWLVKQGRKRFFIIGSDYVFPRMAGLIIKDMLHLLGVQLVGEKYIPFQSKSAMQEKQISDIIQEAEAVKADVLINLINGQDNVDFFKLLKRSGISSREMPVLSMSVSESEISAFSLDIREGDFAVWNYFQSLQTPENITFVKKLRKFVGSNLSIGDPMEAAYIGIKLFAQACAESPGYNTVDIKNAILYQNLLAPEGIVSVDRANLHLWKTVYVGKLLGSGQFDIVWSSVDPVKPQPYPMNRSISEWNEILKEK